METRQGELYLRNVRIPTGYAGTPPAGDKAVIACFRQTLNKDWPAVGTPGVEIVVERDGAGSWIVWPVVDNENRFNFILASTDEGEYAYDMSVRSNEFAAMTRDESNGYITYYITKDLDNNYLDWTVHPENALLGTAVSTCWIQDYLTGSTRQKDLKTFANPVLQADLDKEADIEAMNWPQYKLLRATGYNCWLDTTKNAASELGAIGLFLTLTIAMLI
jgi:hypothetical protein